jgi:hypothetical protein
MIRLALTLLCAVALLGTAHAEDVALTATLNRVADRLLNYYQRAQSIISIETVRMQRLNAAYTPEGFARQLVYELRVEWSKPDEPGADPEPNVARRLLTVNGREPRPSDEPACEDPRASEPEPLFMLLPKHRREFGFSLGRPQRIADRPAVTLDYLSLPNIAAKQTWTKDCVSIPLEGRTRGRIWIDAETDTVLRLEEHLVGMVDVRVPREYEHANGQTWMSLERSDFTVEYKPVRFSDPDETLVLPASIQSLRVFRGSSVSRMRITQTYSGYKRFLTNSRMIRP